MAETIAKSFFPSLYSKMEKKKQEARANPLGMMDINSLLSLRLNKNPVYETIDLFYSEEYREALSKDVSSLDLEKIPRFRKPTEQELNLLYCDIHSREEKFQYSGSNQSEG